MYFVAERIPKQVVLFFNEDHSTSVLNTSIVTQVLGEGEKICDDASLQVNYGGMKQLFLNSMVYSVLISVCFTDTE